MAYIMPTALELSRKERRRYIDAASRRRPLPGPSEEQKEEHRVLLIKVREAAKELKERFGVDRVVLFGSLVQAHWYSSTSDVDLAVRGLKRQDYWEALKVAEDIIGDRNIDLVEIETAFESLRSSIDRYGFEL
jgi:predicted nucleotidyltransferase